MPSVRARRAAWFELEKEPRLGDQQVLILHGDVAIDLGVTWRSSGRHLVANAELPS